MQRTNFLIRSLLLLTIYSALSHGMENTKASKSAFDIFPTELRRKILFEQDPVVLQNAINCMAQQPITIAQDYWVESVIIVGDTIITRDVHPSLEDGTVKIWNAHTGEHIHTLLTSSEFENNPFSLAIHNNKIAVGFTKHTIKIWDMLNAYEQIKTIEEKAWSGKDSRVISLAMDDNNKIIAGAGDTVKIFDIDSGKCLQTFCVTVLLIRKLATNGSYICSGSSDGLVKIFDYTGNCIHSFNDFENQKLGVFAIAMEKDTVIASAFEELRTWDLNTKSCISRFAGWHDGAFFKSAQIDQGKIIVGDHPHHNYTGDTVAKIINVTDGTVLHTLAGFKKHTKGILSVDIKGNIAVTGSKDCTAKIWPLLTNLTGTADTNPSLWIIEKSDPLQANFIRRAHELTDQEKECIIAWPNHFNEIEEDESPAQRDGRIYFSIPVFVRDYLRDHLIIRK